MADERKNLKAVKFEEYTQANNLNFFVKNEVHDEADTVVFQSQLKVEGQTVPVGIITDNTIYTIIRVQVGAGLVKEGNSAKVLDKNSSLLIHRLLVKEGNSAKVLDYLNQLNRSYKVFKYVASEDGGIFLDACLPSTNESFDAEIVRVVLDVVVDHLNSEYKNIMKQAWN